MERARLYKAPNETCFGVQVATNNIAEGLKAAQLAAEAGAAWLDLNCGCPIYGAWGCCLWAGCRRSWVQYACTASSWVAPHNVHSPAACIARPSKASCP